MAKFKLLGRIPKGNSTYYMINDTKQNLEISLEQFCFYLGKGMIDNSEGRLRGIDVVIISKAFGPNPINIIDIPIYKDTNSVSKLRLSKRCRQGRNIVGFYITDGKSEIYKTRQETINLIKSGLIENANLNTSNGEDIIRGINGTSLDELPTISTDNTENKKTIDYSKFIRYLDMNILSAFVYNNIKVLSQNKEENTSGNISYIFKINKGTLVTLKLRLNDDIRATLHIGSTEDYTKSYTNNQNSASELIKDIHEYFKVNLNNKEQSTVEKAEAHKVSLNKPEIERSKPVERANTGNVRINLNGSLTNKGLNESNGNSGGLGSNNSLNIRNNNEYLRILNNVLDTVSKEVYNKIKSDYKNKCIHTEYEVINNKQFITGNIQYKLVSSNIITVEIQCNNENYFRINSIISTDKTKFKISRNRYTFSNEGVKKVYSDILYSILTSGVLDIGLEEDILTSKLENNDDLIMKLQHITRDLQSELTKRTMNIRASIYIRDFILGGVKSTKDEILSTMEMTLSDDNVVNIEVKLSNRDFKVERIVDKNMKINYSYGTRYDINNIFIERIAVNIVDRLLEKNVIY